MKRIGIILGADSLGHSALRMVGLQSPERGTTGSVSTTFRWLGPNDKIVIDSFDDPKVQASPVISPAQTGGVKAHWRGGDTGDAASIVVSRPIKILGGLKDGESVFDEHRSLVFKKLQVVRASSTTRAMCWFTWPTAIGLSRVAEDSISTVPIMGGRRHRFELRPHSVGSQFGAILPLPVALLINSRGPDRSGSERDGYAKNKTEHISCHYSIPEPYGDSHRSWLRYAPQIYGLT